MYVNQGIHIAAASKNSFLKFIPEEIINKVDHYLFRNSARIIDTEKLLT